MASGNETAAASSSMGEGTGGSQKAAEGVTVVAPPPSSPLPVPQPAPVENRDEDNDSPPPMENEPDAMEGDAPPPLPIEPEPEPEPLPIEPEGGDVVAAGEIAPAGEAAGDFACEICGARYPTEKAMFGHLRCHKNRGWRGAFSPPTFSMEEFGEYQEHLGLWFSRDSPLWMLPCMTNDLYNSLSKRGVINVQQLLDLSSANLQSIVGNSVASKLHQDLQHFPRVQVRLRIQRRDSGDNRSHTLNIRLENINTSRRTSKAFTPRYPKIKDEAWWLVLCNTTTSELYALKRVSFSDRLMTHMDLPSAATTFQGMKLLLVSDCYLGFEQEYPIKEYS
nr:DExH-box ATP-dependent RNA helicase DExH14 [Ipomoea batatas]